MDYVIPGKVVELAREAKDKLVLLKLKALNCKECTIFIGWVEDTCVNITSK